VPDRSRLYHGRDLCGLHLRFVSYHSHQANITTQLTNLPNSLAYLYLVFTDPAYNSQGQFTPVVIAYAFLIGLQITNCFTTPLQSGIETIFVAAAWDPEVMMREHPQLYQNMVKVYPHVQQAIHA
jgi:hypothetical protein